MPQPPIRDPNSPIPSEAFEALRRSSTRSERPASEGPSRSSGHATGRTTGRTTIPGRSAGGEPDRDRSLRSDRIAPKEMERERTPPARPLDLAELSAEVERRVGERKFSLWFRETARFTLAEDGAVEIVCDNAFVGEWISRHFREALAAAIEARGGTGFRMRTAAGDDRDPPAAGEDPSQDAGSDAPAGRDADGERLAAAAIASPTRRRAAPTAPDETAPRRTSLRRLEDFVLGSSNHLAFDAARRIAEGEAVSTLLFVHGECGVGKTHLLQGICRRRRERFPRQVVRYVTAEQFTNEFLAALRDGTINAFRKAQRRVDLLAIDDIHFLASKTQTQAEFLHTLDALGLSGGRVVLASDEHPRTIRRFSESLVSRFLSGMVVRVDRPDRATRISLLRSLAAARGLRLATAAEEIIAGRCAGSVREIEGAITRLEALATLLGDGTGEVGAILAERAFADEGIRATGPVRIHDVIRATCESLGVEAADLTGPGRHRKVVLARGVVVFLARELTTMSYPEIARSLGRDTHSTVHTAARRTEAMIASGERVEPADPSLAASDGLVGLGELLAHVRHRVRSGTRAVPPRRHDDRAAT
jgi:chromosomal replication initiator protein